MAARNSLLQAPPYAVEQALKKLGADLRTARLRRNLTVEEVAQKIGAGVRAGESGEGTNAESNPVRYSPIRGLGLA